MLLVVFILFHYCDFASVIFFCINSTACNFSLHASKIGNNVTIVRYILQIKLAHLCLQRSSTGYARANAEWTNGKCKKVKIIGSKIGGILVG